MTLSHGTRRAPPRALSIGLLCTVLLLTVSHVVAAPKAPQPQGTSAAKQIQAELPVDPECLTITQSSTSTYTIANSACPDQSVLASIELGQGNASRCFVKKIRTQISIASEAAAPVINYQCIEGAQGCSGEIVREMFPECVAS